MKSVRVLAGVIIVATCVAFFCVATTSFAGNKGLKSKTAVEQVDTSPGKIIKPRKGLKPARLVCCS